MMDIALRNEKVSDGRKIVLTVMFHCFRGKFNQINAYCKVISNQPCALRYRHLDSGSKAEWSFFCLRKWQVFEPVGFWTGVGGEGG